MPGPSEYSPFDRTPWLLAIGERLRSEYDAFSEPLPERLTALVTQVQELLGTGADAQQRTPARRTGSSPSAGRTNPPEAARERTLLSETIFESSKTRMVSFDAAWASSGSAAHELIRPKPP
jgi:hypothetical protein